MNDCMEWIKNSGFKQAREITLIRLRERWKERLLQYLVIPIRWI
jgi:hypothetical protein